jgi:hypothetical protein
MRALVHESPEYGNDHGSLFIKHFLPQTPFKELVFQEEL